MWPKGFRDGDRITFGMSADRLLISYNQKPIGVIQSPSFLYEEFYLTCQLWPTNRIRIEHYGLEPKIENTIELLPSN